MKILWIAFVWPEPNSSAAGFRTLHMMLALRNAGHSVHVASPCRTNGHREALEQLGFPTSAQRANTSQFDEFIAELAPDVVVFDRFMLEEQFGWRVRARAPEALRVLDTVDLHFVRRAREKALEESDCSAPVSTALSLTQCCSDDAYREVGAVFRSDIALVTSDFELKLLSERFAVPPQSLQLYRFAYEETGEGPSFEQRANFISIGNFHHHPNVDAFHVLHERLWPEIRKRVTELSGERPELHIFGAYPTNSVMSLDNPQSGFRAKGWASDAVQTLSQYRMNLAPLRFGAGIKGKISDGWASGTPCITTSIGAEGMHEDHPFAGSVQDSWSDYVEEAAQLYTNRSRWEAAARHARLIMTALYSAEANDPLLLEAIDSAVRHRHKRRMENFVGGMLCHHQHRSNEFMSRWIEAKNRQGVPADS